MKKYNSIKEMEEDKLRIHNNQNEKCIQAMTDEELMQIKFYVDREITFREECDKK